jgi:hypothetical protein
LRDFFNAHALRSLRDKTLAVDLLARMVCMTVVEACDLGGLNFRIAAGCSSKASDRSGSAGNFSCNLAEYRTGETSVVAGGRARYRWCAGH